MFVKKNKKSFCPLLRIPDIIPTVKVDVWEIFLWSKDKLLSTRGQLELHSCSVLIWCLKWWLESGGIGNNILQFHYMSQCVDRILDKIAKYIKKPCAGWKSMHKEIFWLKSLIEGRRIHMLCSLANKASSDRIN